MTNPDHNLNEQRLEELLRGAQHPATPPDDQFIARLREESTIAFLSSASETGEPDSNPKREQVDHNPKRKRGSGDTTPSPRKSKMFIIAWCALAATAAAVLLTATWFVTSSSGGAVTLAKVLAKTEQASSLHISINDKRKPADKNAASATEAWTAKSDKLRVNQADGTYAIAQKDRLWKIDEKANRAASGESPYYRAETKSLDLLPLVGLNEAKIRDQLLAATALPARETIGGKLYDVYRYRIIDGLRPIMIEAHVDPATQLLHSLETLVDRDGKETPAVTLTVVAANQPVNEDLFVVGDTLTEDGRIGKVSDLQGMVSIKPVMAERWTPVCGSLLLRPGDWLRTDLRGANAVAARLTSKSQVIAGPGTLVELIGPKKVRLYEGEIQVTAAASPLELLGPGDEKIAVKAAGVYRVQKDRLVLAKEDPKWLKGFLGTEVQDSIGSLVANIDGRNVPLTVGYHKVTVDIRDQIARTTVEESFANMTGGSLEGVFYFPLPQDASISGFGMWIGNELVEADIVEKQRAREIYETILREKRDPGLLEWQGGNLFKARVFPIFAHSEKRIRIVYTQVLPRTGNTFRYSYALQSDMLRLHPLRELSIDVKINSVVPLARVSSPTHAVRTAQTEHSAHVEFDAQEYTPTRDFEVVAELKGKQPELTLIPHRRGEDGYFMLLLAPPAEDMEDDRDLLVDKAPVDLILLADTSASMDARQRAEQAEFIAAMLGSLTPRDTVNLACCDVNCDWAFEKAVTADAKNIKTMRQFLDRRASLGWTDLPRAFSQAFQHAGRNTSIVYVGDGIPTTGAADPAATAAELRRLYQEKCAGVPPLGGMPAKAGTPTCHAVSVGSTFELGVLKAIGSLGGGSMRQISGEQGPRPVALDLLKEITRPGLRDLKVQFQGLRVARVYPEQLPNLPGGSQQIISGRYLPEEDRGQRSEVRSQKSEVRGQKSEVQTGRVIVTGKQGDRDVRFEQAVSLAADNQTDSEHGNSFIPRLWARMHLDYLLQQGATPTIKDDIIALSEEYHIITPYTSLLVLESDADRERFKVKRSFTMRNGEKFFAEGRDNANFELMQQQMKRAGTWRTGLRMSVLQQFSTLGRNAGAFQPQWGYDRFDIGGGGGFGGGRMGWAGALTLSGNNSYNGITTVGGGSLFLDGNKSRFLSDSRSAVDDLGFINGPVDMPVSGKLGAPMSSPAGFEFEMGDMALKEKLAGDVNGDLPAGEVSKDEVLDLGLDDAAQLSDYSLAGSQKTEAASSLITNRRMRMSPAACGPVGGRLPWGGSVFGEQRSGLLAYGQRAYGNYSEVDNWLGSLFGTLPAAPSGKRPPAVKPDLPQEVLAISKKLLRGDQLSLKDGGLRIDLHTDNFNARFGELASQSDESLFASARSWLVRSSSEGGQTVIQWCDGKQREIFNRSFMLGRARKAAEEELKAPPIGLNGFVLASLADAFNGQKVSIKHPVEGQALLTFRVPNDDKNDTRVLIDTKRNVVLSIEHRTEGKTTSTQRFGDFIEVAGAWWAGKIESLDDKGRTVNVTTQKPVRLDNDRYAQAIHTERAGRDRVQFLHDPAETELDAKKHLTAKEATFDDHVTLLMHFARSGQWDRAMEHLAAAEKLAAGKPGVRWLRYAVLKSARRNEELKRLFQQEANSRDKPPANELFLANYLLGQANGVLEANEMLTLLDDLRSVFARQPAHLQSLKGWKQQRANWLTNAGLPDAALAIYKELAEAYPHDSNAQTTYVQNLQNRLEYEAERKWIERVLASDVAWLPEEIDQFRNLYAQSLRSQERYEELASYLKQWMDQNPVSTDPYTQYIDALYFTDRSADAEALLDRWFREGRREDLSPAAAARLQAAINWIFTQCQNNWVRQNAYYIDERWQRQIVDTAIFFCLDKNHVSITEQILTDWRFQQSPQSEANQRLRAALAKIFAEKFDRLTLDEINRFIGWLRGNDSLVTKDQWHDYAGRLLKRYETESDADRKNSLAQTVANILSFSAPPDEYMAYLRRLAREAPEKYRPYYVSQLFQTLLQQAWAEKYENEAFDLLGQLGGGQSAERRLLEQIRSLHQLTDRMLAARKDALAKTIVHAEKLTRTELAKKQAEQLRQVREEFAARLAAQETKYETKHGSELATWIAAERMYLDVLLNNNLDKAAENCWKVLDAQPPKIEESSDDAAVVRAELDAVLRSRCLVTLMDLAARKTAPPVLVRRLLAYIDQNIARDLAEKSENQQWKLVKFELLIALDKPKDLEKTLDDWIKAGDPDNRWRVALGYLLAEEGKLAEAIRLFEAVAKADELGPAEWRTLADWYQATGRREDYDRAKVEIYKTAEEWRLNQWLYAQVQPWLYNQGQLPSQLDPEVVLAFRALLSKSANPQNYINSQLRELYKASRDFRLLSCLADSIAGHTAGQIYPYLQSAKGVVDEIHEEAAVDSLIERIAQLQAKATTPKATTDVDRRAFDLLEAMTERRAAELRNQPGPHVDKAVAALQRAFKRSWSPGEERLMADFLAALGAIPQEKLAAEQLRELEAFYNMAKPASQQRLDMACAYARALWSYNRRQQAMDLLQSEIDQYASETVGKPLCEQQIFQDFISYLDQAGQYTAAVKRLENERQHAETVVNRRNLEARIIEVHTDALRNQGQVGDLKAAELYRAVQARILAQLPTGDSPFDARLITLVSALFGTAYDVRIAEASADLKTFAFQTLPPLLRRQVAQYESIENNLAEQLRHVCGPADGIAFLVERYGQRPPWLKLKQNFWNAHGWQLTNWRHEAGKLDGPLSDRLLKLVSDFLREHLLGRGGNDTGIWNMNNPWFWAEREGDFLRVAEEVYAANKHNSGVVCSVADYLVGGLSRMDRAIEILQAAQEEHVLDEGGRWKLVDFLHRSNRFGESIGLLQGLVEYRPGNVDYRGALMYAYFRTNRKGDLLALLKQSDEFFHQNDRWGEGPMAGLAGSCLKCELFEQSVKYYKELIPLHERTAANRGIGDGTLSGYYGSEAQALAGLKRMPEAVEAACGAIVSWGNNVANRAQALEALRNILRGCESEKLDALVAALDAQAAKNGNDNAFVRKALGQVYNERGQYGKALVQLRLALQLQHNDGEIFDALVACCDKQGDKQGAIRELLAKANFDRRDINIYKDLGRRLAELHDEREAERAYTSIVEVLASEAESHTMLAEVRESQGRWADAIKQWRDVARLRALEPTGLLRQAAAEIHEKQWTAAAETVRQLRAKTWPPRFNNIEFQIQQLEQQVDRGRRGQ